MKIKSYLQLLIVFSSILVFSSLVIAQEVQYATSQEETELYNSLDNYYLTFGAKNMDNYLDAQYLDHLSAEELDAKKNLIQQMWEEYTSGYSLDEQDSFVYIVNGSIAFVEYSLSIYLYDLADNELMSKDVKMTAILFQTEENWKIFNTIPTLIFEFNTAVDLFEDNSFENSNVLLLNETTQNNFSKVAIDMHDTNLNNLTKQINDNEIDVCGIDIDLSLGGEGYSLEDSSVVDLLLGNDKLVRVKIGTNSELYYHYIDGYLKFLQSAENVDFTIILDTCTLQRMVEGANPQLEYENGNIQINGEKIGPKLKVILGKVFFKIYSWFAEEPSLELWIEAETGELENPGKYSFVGSTSRGPGELYLGTKDSFVKYSFTLNDLKTIYLYARVNDDGLHKDGARSVLFDIDGVKKTYEHKSINYVVDGYIWGWVFIGEYDLSGGKHEMIITKPAQTSAAFIADKFVLFEEKKDISSFN